MKMILVIHEKDHEDNETDIIGVAESIERAQIMIDTYYGEYEELEFKDLRDYDDFQWSKRLRVGAPSDTKYEVTVTLEWFCINYL